MNPQPIGYEPTALTIELQGLKLVQGAGIEPALGPHLGHTRYKLVGTSSYTNLAKIGSRGGTRTLTPLLATDFLTTMVFTTISVCSLDFTLTIAFASGSCRQVSTPSSFDAWLGIRILHPSPNLTSYI